MLTNTQTPVRNGLEVIQGKNIAVAGFAAILEMFSGKLSAAGPPNKLQNLSQEQLDEGLFADVGTCNKNSSSEQAGKEAMPELLSMLLGIRAEPASKELNEASKNDQYHFEELSKELSCIITQNPPIQEQVQEKQTEASIKSSQETFNPASVAPLQKEQIKTVPKPALAQKIISQIPKILKEEDISYSNGSSINNNIISNKDYKKKDNVSMEGLAGIKELRATEQIVPTQDKLTGLINKVENDFKSEQTEPFAKSKDDVREITRISDRDFVFEQIVNQIDTGKPTANERSIEIKASRLPKELPEIVKCELQQVVGKEGSRDLVVQLEPKELGKMLVKLVSQDGIVSVKILVEQPESKILLDNGMQNLKQVFSEQGIKYGRIDVEIGGQFTGQNNQQQPNWFKEQHPQRRYDLSEGQYYSDYEPIQATRTITADSNVDYLV